MRKFSGLVAFAAIAGCTGSGDPVHRDIARIDFATEEVPAGGAGQLYNERIEFQAAGGARKPDRFEVGAGELPPGVRLVADREDLDGDGMPDEDGAPTGDARLIGFPRDPGTFRFRLRAIATTQEDLPPLAAEEEFTVEIQRGRINVLTPTAQQGSVDPAVPAFPAVVDFVNPTNPQAFFSFAFQAAGGSGDNVLSVYMPRELELSTFDRAVAGGLVPISHDLDEAGGSGDKLEPDFNDGGWFALQAGPQKAQVGGFQSPRGVVGTITQHGPVGSPSGGLDPQWFQRPVGAGGPVQNSRRDLADTLGLAGGDTLLIPGRTISFSDYFDPNFEGTDAAFEDPDPLNPPVLQRRKYPFTADQYHDAFFLDFTPGVDVTPLRFYVLVEAIDRNFTVDKEDDAIARKAFPVQVRIPDITVDTVALPSGQAGVDYAAVVAASGGVPPLRYELEWADGTADRAATAGDALTLEILGLGMEQESAQFIGAPTVSGDVDLTVRVFADVMSVSQSSATAVPQGEGLVYGTHPVTGKTGAHRTYTVSFAPPTAPAITNTSLPSGIDGQAYPGATVNVVGGVPKVVPSPVGFVGPYPSGSVTRTYAIDASYIRDASYGANEGTVDPDRKLPNALVLDGNPDSATNGRISGTPFDRGFHTVTFFATDFYHGDASTPDLALNAQTSSRTLGLGIGPDTALYLRGAQSGTGSTPSGLLDATNSMAEARMVPMFLAATLFRGETGGEPKQYSALPPSWDLLPVMLAHGGDDEHVDKSGPSLSGFWPAESNTEVDWQYSQDRAWMHLQQENVWVQLPSGRRLFLWGETQMTQWESGASGGWSKRYQEHVPDGLRGVLMVDPMTSDFWVPAILENDNGAHGSQFGAEVVILGNDSSYYYYDHGVGYWKFYYYEIEHSAWDRELLSQGLGSALEQYNSALNTSQGWYKSPQGRSAVSVAVSADGLWAATALPGGSEQRFLLWRTDGKPVPGAILSQSYVQALSGRDANGNTMQNSACIVNVGGETAGGVTIASHQRYLLPDSLCFVQDGLLFLNETQLNRVFGFSLVDGHLSSAAISGSVFVSSSTGMYPPDQDYLRGLMAKPYFSVQFAFAVDEAEPGETGGDTVAFVAGSNARVVSLDDNTFYGPLSSRPRDGYQVGGNRAKSLFVLELSKNGSGLDLSTDTLKDLTGTDSRIYGDLLTPGRIGEEQDTLALSADGKYVAVVRDWSTTDYFFSSVYPSGAMTFATMTATYTSTTTYQTNDDLLVISVDGEDMDDDKSGVQSVLYLGSASLSINTTTDPSMPDYASGKAYLNGRMRRIHGLVFAGERSLFFNYAAHYYHPKFPGYAYGWGTNPHATNTYSWGTAMCVRMQYRTSEDGPIGFSDNAGSFLTNALDGFSGVKSIGPTALPFSGPTTYTVHWTETLFWSTFRSESGDFLYYVVDGRTSRNFLVGFNVTDSDIGSRSPFVPFSPHADTVGLEQIDVNSFNYENRFFAVPAGVVLPQSGRDGAGIVCFVASDASAGAVSATDLEVYAFDANVGGDAVALTSAVTTGGSNAINHLYMSADGNVLVAQRAATAANSRDSRATLNGNTDLVTVTNIHAALAGAPPNAFVLSAGRSHGSSVAFVGEGTSTGPQAILFSSAAAGGNDTWDDRTLNLGTLTPDQPHVTIDETESHYVILSGGRRLDDNPSTSN